MRRWEHVGSARIITIPSGGASQITRRLSAHVYAPVQIGETPLNLVMGYNTAMHTLLKAHTIRPR